ncbi:GapA-binding peptide SR1P [Thermoactinomyces mirandus]|uniref:GapA-binding peptide SR1P n=1 Tax=Thermoactinomyces mirandus TaxID=2756294 RepID=A0A7W2APR0_9BACL|nr:GapA-binding peptide SR1P [Thermoactinomyces mirandus]MBA4601204.1 GapA-binding peptide SR1P [Thermoactinomyces mirandus]
MEAIVCQLCDKVIAYVESEKAGTLYGTCPGCKKDESEPAEKAESLA